MNNTLGFSIDNIDPTANPAQDFYRFAAGPGSIKPSSLRQNLKWAVSLGCSGRLMIKS